MFQLNRSDSDSAMPLYKRLPFQRRLLERRSLRVPCRSNVATSRNSVAASQNNVAFMLPMRLNVTPTSPGSKLMPGVLPSWNSGSKKCRHKSKLPKIQTPLDLELDLAAQQVWLFVNFNLFPTTSFFSKNFETYVMACNLNVVECYPICL